MSKGTLLLVQESATQRAHLSSTLEQSGFTVFQASGASDGLQSAQANRPVVVVSDISLADDDGFSLTRAIRADSSLKDVPVLLMTGLSDAEDVVGALESGASGFLLKPFSDEELEARIDFLLANPVAQFVSTEPSVKVNFLDGEHSIGSTREQTLSLLLTTFESAARHHKQISKETLALKMRIRELERQVGTSSEEPVPQASVESENCPWSAHLRQLPIPLQVHSNEGIAVYSSPLWEDLLGDMVLAGADSSLEGSVVEGKDQANFVLSIRDCRWENQEAQVVFATARPIEASKSGTPTSSALTVRTQIGEDLLNGLATHHRNLTRGIRKGLSVLVGNEPQIAQIEQLVAQVEGFDLFALDSSALLMKSTSVDMQASLTDILETFPVRQEVAQKGLNISLDCAAGVTANGDSRLLRLATVELLKNAIFASQAGGPVRLRALSDATKLVISVRDAGAGIGEEIRDQVTERFFSTWPGRVGLGLYLARRVAQAHGGSLSFVHHSNGTEAILEIPQV
jgi:DNA-binding response OmpR family regulator